MYEKVSKYLLINPKHEMSQYMVEYRLWLGGGVWLWLKSKPKTDYDAVEMKMSASPNSPPFEQKKKKIRNISSKV